MTRDQFIIEEAAKILEREHEPSCDAITVFLRNYDVPVRDGGGFFATYSRHEHRDAPLHKIHVWGTLDALRNELGQLDSADCPISVTMGLYIGSDWRMR